MSEAPPTAEQSSPGRALADAREALKLSVADVSQQIKYGVKQIAAIEADDYAKLPGTTFVRGMIRSYARLVHIDSAPLLVDLGRRDIPAPITVDLRTSGQEPFVEGGKKSNRIYVFLSLAALVAVAAVAFEWWINPLDTGEIVTIVPRSAQGDAGDVTPVPASASAPMPAPAAPAPASVPAAVEAGEVRAAESREPEAAPVGAVKGSVSGRNRIELEFDQQSWVQIKQATGKILLSQLNPAGSRQLIEGMPPFDVVIGNAAKVRLKYNDAPVDLRPHFKVDVARLTLE
ncbi:MAG: helix-turn-helix domain-containing protein [Betaproteobacteria bacterium]|nr:MAG: helix-turn-helix domain-containing protein [Betaproteobacteria bacterium]